MWGLKKKDKPAFPPVTFSLNDASHVKELKMLIHQMMQQEAEKRLDMNSVCNEIVKINGESVEENELHHVINSRSFQWIEIAY